MAKISVVIPVYNAEATVPVLYKRLRAALESITPDFEILLIEDCGRDRSWDIIVELARQDPRVKGIRFSRNFGQHHGITAGIDVCDGDWVIVMDCDLQDEPEEIPRLYAKATEGYDVVLACREARSDRFLKRACSWVFYKVFGYLTGIKCDAGVGVFRIMSRTVVEQLRLMREQLRFFVGLMEWMGFPTASIKVRHGERPVGKSTYTVRTLLRLAGSAIIAYSDKPLRLFILLGFFLSLFAFGYGTYIIWRFFVYGSPIIGWSSLIVSVYFMGGIIVSILGILGVYLGKVFDETKRRPLYIVRERINL